VARYLLKRRRDTAAVYQETPERTGGSTDVDPFEATLANTPVKKGSVSGTYAEVHHVVDEATVRAGGTLNTDPWSGVLAHLPVVPGSVVVTFNETPGGVARTATDDGLGVIVGTGVTGTINYATGAVTLASTANNVNDSTVRIDYDYSSATVRTFADDGAGVLTSATGSGTIDYETGELSFSSTGADVHDSTVLVDYEQFGAAVKIADFGGDQDSAEACRDKLETIETGLSRVSDRGPQLGMWGGHDVAVGDQFVVETES
jgi:hypothetical protein